MAWLHEDLYATLDHAISCKATTTIGLKTGARSHEMHMDTYFVARCLFDVGFFFGWGCFPKIHLLRIPGIAGAWGNVNNCAGQCWTVLIRNAEVALAVSS